MERTKTNGQAVGQRVAQLQVLASMVDRLKLARQLGESYQGKRNIYEALGYPISLTYNDYLSRYRRQDMAKALIDRPVKATWQGGVTVLESDDDRETPFEKGWQELDEELGLVKKLSRLDRLACLGEYGALLLGFDDVTRDTWHEPVSPGQRKLLYVKPLGQTSAQIKTWETDPSSPRYGMPRHYSITLNKPGTSGKDTYTIIAHYSRVLHVAMDLLDDEVEGEPILQAVFNRLMDLEKLVGGSAEMFWRGARPGYQGKVEPDFKMSQDQEDQLMEQLDEYEHNLRRFLVAEGVDIQALASQISDPSAHVDIQVQMISAMTGIPKRILTGSERGELASSQDQETWKEMIQTRREESAEVLILRPLIEHLVEVGVLPKYTERYSIQWSDLFAASAKDKVELGKTRMDALKAYASEPGAEMLMPFAAFLQHFLGMDPDQIALIEEQRDQALRDMVEEEEEDDPPQPPPTPPDPDDEDQGPDDE